MKSPIFCCGYPVNRSLLLLDTHRLTTTTEANDNATPPTTPYINGIFEIISRIHVAYKPITTLRQLLTNATDKDEPRNRQGAVLKINRSDYHAFYIGEIGRNLTTDWTQASDEERRCQQSHFVKFCLHYTTEHTKQHLGAWTRRSARPMIHFINSRDKNPLLQ